MYDCKLKPINQKESPAKPLDDPAALAVSADSRSALATQHNLPSQILGPGKTYKDPMENLLPAPTAVYAGALPRQQTCTWWCPRGNRFASPTLAPPNDHPELHRYM